jgi:hypothetical protein
MMMISLVMEQNTVLYYTEIDREQDESGTPQFAT